MQFQLTEEQLMIQSAARDFAQNQCKPGVIDRDENQKFPAEQMKMLGELGFMGMMVDPKYGGGGMDAISYSIAVEEISKVDASCSVVMSVNNSLVCWGLEHFGNEEQKQKYLVPLAKGELIGAFCLSEPEAGSDATSQRTLAIDKGDYYELTGTKNWITNGSSASVYLVMAQTNVELGHKGINCLIVERGMEGFTIGPKENKMGIRGSDTHSLMFDAVKVPKANRIGEDGFGFKYAGKSKVDEENVSLATLTHEFTHFISVEKNQNNNINAQNFFKELKKLRTSYRKELKQSYNDIDKLNEIFLGDYANTDLKKRVLGQHIG
jgi:alkylation response protein AidB-like acyl-CoA dehydrogenase